MLRYCLILFSSFVLFASCKQKVEEQTLAEQDISQTMVTVGIASDTIKIVQEVTLTAISSYMLKTEVKANATGYITNMRIKLGDRVSRGQVIFQLETKEARALGNTINKLDKSFRFNGSTSVTSPATGYVEIVNYQPGDYVQDGEVLATITDASSFGFVLNLPYEYNQLVSDGKKLIIDLPDGSSLGGYIARRMPSLDSVSQTQQVLIKVYDQGVIPENLIGNIKLTKEQFYGLSVPKTSVVSDETQSEYWVMKLINDSTAIKTSIVPGLENDKFIQVKSGNVKSGDRVVLSGNFGMSDTASLKIGRN